MTTYLLNNSLKFSFLFSFLLFVFSGTLLSQNLDSLLSNKRVYQPQHIGEHSPPKIDGILDDEIWQLGEFQGNFTQQQPYGNTPGTESTYVKVLYDRSNLYVAIVCQDDEPEKIRDIFDRRDALTGDMTGIAIDSYYDKRTAFEFNMSAAGQKTDIKHKGDYLWDLNWDAVWDGAASLNDTGWVAEMRIPFSQLRYTNKPEHTWGMHVWRWIERKKEEDQWQYIPVEAPAMVYLFGKMEGVKDIQHARQVEFLPYALGAYDPTHSNPFTFNGGLDAKVGISSDYTLDLTVNPDFGQVEADPSVLNLTSFETFYEEKRPFFLEGNDVFDFEMDGDLLYYSRRIGSAPQFPSFFKGNQMELPDRTTILSAAKLTGKSKNGLNIGFVNGLTAKELGNELGNEEEIEVEPLTNYMASRVKKEFKEGNSMVGGYVSLVERITDSEDISSLLADQGFTLGADMMHQWNNRNYFVEAKAVASQLKGTPDAILLKQTSHAHRFQRLDATHLNVDTTLERLNGTGGLVKIGKKGGRWNFSGQGQFRSPGLNLNDMGYIRVADFISERMEVVYDMNEPTKRIRDYNLELYHEAGWSFGGENTMHSTGAEFAISNLKLWNLFLMAQYDFSALETRALWGGPALRYNSNYQLGFSASTNSSKNLYGSLGYFYNGAMIADFSSGMFAASLTWLPIRRIRLSSRLHLSHTFYYQQYVTTIPTDDGAEYIVATIDRNTASLTLRGELFVTPEISLQYYGNPYISAGKYTRFKRVIDAGNSDLSERFENLETSYDANLNTYAFPVGGTNFSINNPDFSFTQYRSNLVFRWEYKLGSTLYFVWSHDRSDWQDIFNPLMDITGNIFGLKGRNILMLKLNYWFSV
ncbi:DUF5916 domain-containing protein [Bacteroidota bacterium]